jgi:hypothetical protein
MTAPAPGHWFFADADEMLQLANDLERIARGRGPSAADFENAPELVNWKLTYCQVPTLAGITLGHPTFGNRPIVTSPLMAIDEAGSWARTKSRWYRLFNTTGRLDG